MMRGTRADWEARMVAAQIVNMLREHHRATPNERTNSALTSYRQNANAAGIFEAISVIAKEYRLDVSDPGIVKMGD